MTLFKNRNINKWLSFLTATLLLIFAIWASSQFVLHLKKEEKQKVLLFAKAQELLNSDEEISPQTQDFLLDVIQQGKSIPIILTDEKNQPIEWNNIGDYTIKSKILLTKKLREMRNTYTPIVIQLPEGKNIIYFENSFLLNALDYFPLLLFFVVSIFALFSNWYFKTINDTEQSFLWAGMAKETAHQIGTPLSSLLGWLELLKMEDIDQMPIKEMEHDVIRLNQIAERFSKIGSIPELTSHNIITETKKSLDYLKPRISSQIIFSFNAPPQEIFVRINAPLYAWVIENLIKNATDAMQNKGNLNIQIFETGQYVNISVTDTGQGIPSGKQKEIFTPGFTTKKRGWGLGLSLAKRIIEKYHRGKIFVAKSEKNKGTEIRIVLKKYF